jgi:hypothetical protein
MAREERNVGAGSIEYELTMHLERAHELAERARRASAALNEQLARAREIADQIMGVAEENK